MERFLPFGRHKNNSKVIVAMKNNRSFLFFHRILFILLALLLGFHPAAAQDDPSLTLRLSRDFGYASGTGDIQGTFSMRVSGPENLVRVVYYLDEQEIGSNSSAPFQLRFNTDSYSLGAHRLYAVGITSDGSELRSNEIRAEFVSADQSFEAAGAILLPLLVVIGIAMLLSLVPAVIGGKKLQNLAPGTPRQYGAAGGAICPKCQRPFSRHFFSANMLLGKLERCPFCGKWSIVRARPMAELRAAEQAELADAQNGMASPISAEEKMRRDLDHSRYQDL